MSTTEILWSINSLHAQLCRELSRTSEVQRISNEFNTLKTNHEKVLFSYNLLNSHHYLPHVIKDKKSDNEAQDLKQQGNALFESKKYFEAYKKYNKSIAHANISDAEILPQVFTNRASIFLVNKMYDECLKDIKNASKYKISVPLHKKLVEMEKKIQKHKGKKRMTENDSYYTTIPEITNKNETLECASDSIKMETNSKEGRHIKTLKKIQPGDVIAVEKPYSAVLLTEFFNTHCFHCFRNSFNLIPCFNCTLVMYCSPECRETSMRHHKYECPFLLTMLKLGVSKLEFLALRVVITSRNYYENVDNLKIMQDGIYRSGRYQEIHYLMSNQDKRTPSDMFKRSTTAAVFYHFLKTTNFFDQFPDDKIDVATRFICDYLLHHLQTAPTNMHEIAELNGTLSSEEGYQCEEIGAGAYSFMSLLNHSCTPNVVRHCFGTTMVLRALRPIEEGQQLFDNYGYHHALMSREDRRIQLQAQYRFLCECEACIHDWPLYQELKVVDDEIVVTDSELEALKHGNRDIARKITPKLIKTAIELEGSIPSRNLADNQEILKQCFAVLANKRTLNI